MKSVQRFYLVISILIFFGNTLSGQKKQIGIDIGIGKTKTYMMNPHIYPFGGDNQYLDNYLKIGFCYQYTPKKTFSFKTGLYYDYRGDKDAGFLRVPAGIELSIGRAFQFVFGFGLYSGFLISYNGSEDPNKLNLGIQSNLGIAFQLSPTVNLNIAYQKDFDMTTFYVYHLRSPGGNRYSEPWRGFDGFLNVSFKFDLLKK